MTTEDLFTETIGPALVAVCTASGLEKLTVNFKRDTTIIGRQTFLSVLNAALDGTGLVANVGAAYNGGTVTSNAATFRGFFKNVAAVRADVRRVVGTDAALDAADAAALAETMKTLKSVLRCVDVECFVHKCTSDKTAPSYQHLLIGRSIRRAIKYLGGKSAQYEITVGKLDAAISAASKLIAKAHETADTEKAKIAIAKAASKSAAKAASKTAEKPV